MQSLTQQNNKLQETTLIDDLSNEIKAIVTEGEFSARWTLIETYYQVGKALEVYIGQTDKSVSDITATVAVKTGISERSLYYALKMVRTYTDINTLPEGKAISWKKLITKYLTEPKQVTQLPEPQEELFKCPNCGFLFSKYDLNKKE